MLQCYNATRNIIQTKLNEMKKDSEGAAVVMRKFNCNLFHVNWVKTLSFAKALNRYVLRPGE